MPRVKRCHHCSHPKSRHKSWRGKGYCIETTPRRGQTFMGIRNINFQCECPGYEFKEAAHA